MASYNCHAARSDLQILLDILQSNGLLSSPVYRELLDEMLTGCRPCEKAPKRCVGWKVEIAPASPLQFRPTEFKGRAVRVELATRVDFARSAPGRDADWESAPTAASSTAVTIFAGNDDRPVERHHIDFGEPGQAGPLWHLQAGGNPAGHEKFETSWLKIPRWPFQPTDLALACEMVVMNFYEDEWATLRTDGQWVNLIQRAEDLVLSGYSRHLESYLGKGRAGARNATWLSMMTEDYWDCRAR